MRKNARLKLRFFEKYKFPEDGIGEPHDHGWFGKSHIKLLMPLIKNKKLILELGSWVGKSAMYWLKNSNANVICIDTWNGSTEHYGRFDKMLKCLKGTFLANTKEWKDRVFPLQMKTINGLAELYKHNIHPDFIYIDASHEYEDVFVDLSLCYNYFPNAIICGDDWNWSKTDQPVYNVKLAVDKFCKINNINIIVEKNHVWLLDHNLK